MSLLKRKKVFNETSKVEKVIQSTITFDMYYYYYLTEKQRFFFRSYHYGVTH